MIADTWRLLYCGIDRLCVHSNFVFKLAEKFKSSALYITWYIYFHSDEPVKQYQYSCYYIQILLNLFLPILLSFFHNFIAFHHDFYVKIVIDRRFYFLYKKKSSCHSFFHRFSGNALMSTSLASYTQYMFQWA